MKISSIFKVLPYIEMIDVDKVDAGCIGVFSGCYFKRSKEKLPTILMELWDLLYVLHLQ
jgi:hypothetical protein